jgi:hypothetical protein
LETIPTILPEKCKKHFSEYGVEMVIGNILNRHKHEVIIFEPNRMPLEIKQTVQEIQENKDIEQKIVDFIVDRHNQYIIEKSQNRI